eukprot:Sspe_Gene.85603::Locus_56337_Transcript_1_1_Confidence_1.000_Length_1687::g.85603::m.85603
MPVFPFSPGAVVDDPVHTSLSKEYAMAEMRARRRAMQAAEETGAATRYAALSSAKREEVSGAARMQEVRTAQQAWEARERRESARNAAAAHSHATANRVGAEVETTLRSGDLARALRDHETADNMVALSASNSATAAAQKAREDVHVLELTQSLSQGQAEKAKAMVTAQCEDAEVRKLSHSVALARAEEETADQEARRAEEVMRETVAAYERQRREVDQAEGRYTTLLQEADRRKAELAARREDEAAALAELRDATREYDMAHATVKTMRNEVRRLEQATKECEVNLSCARENTKDAVRRLGEGEKAAIDIGGQLADAERMCAVLSAESASAKDRQTATRAALSGAQAREMEARAAVAEARRALERCTGHLEASRSTLHRAKGVEYNAAECASRESTRAAHELLYAAREHEHLSVAREREASLRRVEGVTSEATAAALRDRELATAAHRDVALARAIHDASPRRMRLVALPPHAATSPPVPSPSPFRAPPLSPHPVPYNTSPFAARSPGTLHYSI